jgi:hypothetical protein
VLHGLCDGCYVSGRVLTVLKLLVPVDKQHGIYSITVYE